MNTAQWSIVIGVAMSAVLALAPWMFMVHAKLAVIAARVFDLCDQVQKASEAHQKLWSLYAEHEARLDTHDVRIEHISHRLQDTHQEPE